MVSQSLSYDSAKRVEPERLGKSYCPNSTGDSGYERIHELFQNGSVKDPRTTKNAGDNAKTVRHPFHWLLREKNHFLYSVASSSNYYGTNSCWGRQEIPGRSINGLVTIKE